MSGADYVTTTAFWAWWGCLLVTCIISRVALFLINRNPIFFRMALCPVKKLIFVESPVTCGGQMTQLRQWETSRRLHTKLFSFQTGRAAPAGTRLLSFAFLLSRIWLLWLETEWPSCGHGNKRNTKDGGAGQTQPTNIFWVFTLWQVLRRNRVSFPWALHSKEKWETDAKDASY